MEDQQSDSGDLTAAGPEPKAPQGKSTRTRHRLSRRAAQQSPEAAGEPTQDATDEVADEVTAEVSEPVVSDEGPESVDEVSDGESPAESTEQILVPHRTAGRGLKIAAAVAGVAVIAASAFAGAAVYPYLHDRATVQVKVAIAEAAAGAISTLFTYTPDDMESLPNRAAAYLNPTFAQDYRAYIDSIVAGNKQAQITSTTEVVGAAVESINGNQATALVYTNSVATSPLTKGIPSLRYQSHRVTLERTGGKWLITQMVGVTSVDLTPRL